MWGEGGGFGWGGVEGWGEKAYNYNWITIKILKKTTDALALSFLDATFPPSEYEVALRPVWSSTPCYFPAFTTINYAIYLHHNKLWHSQDLKHFTTLVESKEMSPRDLSLLENTLHNNTKWFDFPAHRWWEVCCPNVRGPQAFLFSLIKQIVTRGRQLTEVVL